jgi:dephospho-CoA kinase
MIKVGLTGGIASGKSVVAEMFARLGAHLVYADRIAHELMQPGQAIHNAVVQKFGSEILNPDGTVNRPKLAEVAFGSPERGTPSRVEELNHIVHPAVIQRQDDWMEEVGHRDPTAIAMVEAALILEAGAAQRFDKLVVVTCRPEQRIERFAQRMKIDREAGRREVERRMAAQLPDEEKARVADFVIDNSGSLDATDEQVRAIYTKLREQARAR